ncbi:MAG: methyltransferase family protein [Promethearchaeota archaeon]
MNSTKKLVKNKILTISTNIFSILIPFFQYVPATAIWFGIMSVPVVTYIFYFFQNPNILIYDIGFLLRTPGTYIAIWGLTIFIYALILQITNRKHLIQKGPYKIVRHPQYIAFIIMTFGMTLVTFQTSPITNLIEFDINPYSMILLIWIIEVLAYIVLAKIEDFALKNKYGKEFVEYQNSVGFMIPKFAMKKNLLRFKKDNN